MTSPELIPASCGCPRRGLDANVLRHRDSLGCVCPGCGTPIRRMALQLTFAAVVAGCDADQARQVLAAAFGRVSERRPVFYLDLRPRSRPTAGLDVVDVTCRLIDTVAHRAVAALLTELSNAAGRSITLAATQQAALSHAA